MFPPVAIPKSGLDTAQIADLVMTTVFGNVAQVSPEQLADETDNEVFFWSPKNVADAVAEHGVTPDLSSYVQTSAYAADQVDRHNAMSAAGENGWVNAAGISLIGLSTVDLVGIPTTANEVLVKFQGLSPTATANLHLQAINDVGAIASASEYYGYTQGASGAAINPGSSINIGPGLVAADFVSGQVLFRRHQVSGGTANFFADSAVFQAASRNYFTRASTPNVGAGLTGIRMLLSTGTWDSGTVYISWRK